MHLTKRLLPLVLLVAAACTRGNSGSPTCGIALLAGPGLITSQQSNARAVLTDPPRGIPDSLPALPCLAAPRPKRREHGASGRRDGAAPPRRWPRARHLEHRVRASARERRPRPPGRSDDAGG